MRDNCGKGGTYINCPPSSTDFPLSQHCRNLKPMYVPRRLRGFKSVISLALSSINVARFYEEKFDRIFFWLGKCTFRQLFLCGEGNANDLVEVKYQTREGVC